MMVVMMIARELESYKYVFWFCVQMISEKGLGLSISRISLITLYLPKYHILHMYTIS